MDWHDKREAEAIATAYWADTIDPDEARDKLFTIFRLAAGIDFDPLQSEIDKISDEVDSFIEAHKPN